MRGGTCEERTGRNLTDPAMSRTLLENNIQDQSSPVKSCTAHNSSQPSHHSVAFKYLVKLWLLIPVKPVRCQGRQSELLMFPERCIVSVIIQERSWTLRYLAQVGRSETFQGPHTAASNHWGLNYHIETTY